MNNPQTHKPATQNHYDDEISLVDLAKTLIKRRNWIFIVFVIGFALSLLFAWIQKPQPIAQSDQQLYTTLIAVGYKSSIDYLEPLEGIKEQLTSAFIPQASQNTSFSAQATVMEKARKKSNIIKITSLAQPNQQEEIAAFHQAIFNPLLKRHESLIEEIKSNAEKLTEAPLLVNTSIASLAQPLPAPQQPEAKSKSNLIIAIGLVLSLMIGFMAAFFAEFASQVRQSLQEEI